MLSDAGIDRDRHVAYFSMEVALDSNIPTYSGGLGIFAGDILRSAADLELPMVGVGLVYDKGYFYQMLDDNGNQKEYGYHWDFSAELERLDVVVEVMVRNRSVKVGGWSYKIIGHSGHVIPVYLLDTNLQGNDENDRMYTGLLYDATPAQRLVQELILGVGGVRILHALGYRDIRTYHMNEGHSSLMTLELMQRYGMDADKVRRRCVFTTHTPVPAGHDHFDIELAKQILGDSYHPDIPIWCGDGGDLNMTRLALTFSGFVNAVSKKHREVAREMLGHPGIDSISNGVHVTTWLHPLLKQVYERYLPPLEHGFFVLAHAKMIDSNELWEAHQTAKKQLLEYEKTHSWMLLDTKLFTIGFARRITEYKRPMLLFQDPDRLGELCRGKAQIIMAGKTHPRDTRGKELIQEITRVSTYLLEHYGVRMVFLENYTMDLAKLMVAGSDLWVNTPRRYQEASGTSGMKAAINGVLNLSVQDGWWIEGFSMSDGYAGWSIGPGPEDPQAIHRTDREDASDLYEKLEREIIPLYHLNRDIWIHRMKYAIALGVYFNTHRVVREYAAKAWKLAPQKRWTPVIDHL